MQNLFRAHNTPESLSHLHFIVTLIIVAFHLFGGEIVL